MTTIHAGSQTRYGNSIRVVATLSVALLSAGVCSNSAAAKNLSAPPLLARAIHDNDTVRTLGYMTNESDFLSKKGSAVTSKVNVIDVGFEDEANNREAHHTSETFNLYTAGKLTSTKTFTLDVVFAGGRVYYRDSANRKWRSRKGTTFVDPLTGAAFARGRTTLTFLLRSNFSQRGATPSGEVRFHGTTSLGLVIDPTPHTMSADVFTTTGRRPYVTSLISKGARESHSVRIQSTVSLDLTSFNQKRVISVPH